MAALGGRRRRRRAGRMSAARSRTSALVKVGGERPHRHRIILPAMRIVLLAAAVVALVVLGRALDAGTWLAPDALGVDPRTRPWARWSFPGSTWSPCVLPPPGLGAHPRRGRGLRRARGIVIVGSIGDPRRHRGLPGRPLSGPRVGGAHDGGQARSSGHRRGGGPRGMEDRGAHAAVARFPFNLLNYAFGLTRVSAPRLRPGLVGRHAAGHRDVRVPGVAWPATSRAAAAGAPRTAAEWALYAWAPRHGGGHRVRDAVARAALAQRTGVGDRRSRAALEPWDEHNRALVDNVQPAGLGQPHARRPLQPGGPRRGHGGAGRGHRRRRPRRPGGPGRARADGRRLPERGLRAVQGAAPRRRAPRRTCATRATSASVCPPGARVDFAAVMERMRRLRARASARPTRRRALPGLGVDVFLGEGALRRPGHAWRWAGTPSGSEGRSSPPARAPPRRPSPGSTRRATSPTRPCSISPRCRGAWP